MNKLELSQCKFAADIVPYMYGELSASGSSAFESHLLDCGDCTDEFAVISNARFEIYEWKKLEFDPLETPRFVIPSDESVEAASWFHKFRAAFSSGWAVPAAGFAALAVISIFAMTILFSDSVTKELANVTKDEISSPVVESPALLPTAPVTNPASAASKDDVAATEVKNDGREDGAARNNTRARHTAIRRVVPAPKPTRSLEERNTTAVKPAEKVPTLNEYSDDEDNSLRLAELFEDVETR